MAAGVQLELVRCLVCRPHVFVHTCAHTLHHALRYGQPVKQHTWPGAEATVLVSGVYKA